MEYLSKNFTECYRGNGLPIPVDTTDLTPYPYPTKFIGRRYCDMDTGFIYQWTAGTPDFWQLVEGVPPKTITPILSGVIVAYEDTEIVVTIDNYNALYTYTVSVTGGTFVDNLDGTITWSLPLVPVDTDHTMSVVANDGINADSLPGTHLVDVQDVILVDDQIIDLNPVNFGTDMVDIWNMSTPSNLISDYSLVDTYKAANGSTTTQLGYDELIIQPQVGDTFAIQESTTLDENLFEVAAVDDVLFFITPVVATYAAPTELFFKNHKALSKQYDQDVADTEWYGTGFEASPDTGTTIKEAANNVIDLDHAADQTVDKIYVDNSIFNARVGDVYHADGETFKVDTVNNDGTTDFAIYEKGALGGGHSLIIVEDGEILSTGTNLEGATGKATSTTYVSYSPKIFGTCVAAGMQHSAYIDLNNNLFVTGLNTYGQLGLGDTTNRFAFEQVPGIKAKRVYAGGSSLFIIDLNDVVWGCGHNNRGSLGVGDNIDKDIFTKTSPEAKALSVHSSSDDSNTLLIALNNEIQGCGVNDDGQLGLGTYDTKNSFTPTSTGIKGVRCGLGAFYGMILKSDGTVWASGSDGPYSNTDPRGLNGSPNDELVFIQVPGITATDLVASSSETLIIDSTGEVAGCGYNTKGQLGLDNNSSEKVFTKHTIPVLATKLIGFISNGFSLQKSDGIIYSAGNNASGQFGNGGTVDNNEFTSSNSIAEDDFKLNYFPNYWVTPTTSLSAAAATYVYPITEIDINGELAAVNTVDVATVGEVNQILDDVRFTGTMALKVGVRAPELADISNIVIPLQKEV